MKTGVVDESWAKEHHEIWYDEQLKAGNVGRVNKPNAPSAKNPQPVAVGGDD
jgi:hypothetical protein